jgi:hypothetical protein
MSIRWIGSCPACRRSCSARLDQVNSTNPDVRGNIILFHDAGGDRSETVAALPIDDRQAAGARLSLRPRLRSGGPDAAIRRCRNCRRRRAAHRPCRVPHLLRCSATFSISASWRRSGSASCGCSSLLGLSSNRPNELEQGAPPRRTAHSSSRCLIPAYNEEKVIAKTVERILESDYRQLEIVVVDDGSQDNTSGVLRARFDNDPTGRRSFASPMAARRKR